MDQLLRFLQTYEIWIYLLLGGVGAVYLHKLLSSYQDWRGAIFGLERENAQRKLSASLTILVLIMLFAATEFVMVSFVSPVLPKTAALLTPTIDLLATPTITLSPEMSAAGTTQPPAVPQAAEAESGCVAGEIEWNLPAAGEEISGSVELFATITIPDLAFYKYEYGQPGSETWVTLAGGNSIKNNELIGTWNTEQLLPGDYRLRLIVYNTQNQQLPACELSIRVIAPKQR